ncbi:MAG: sugar phosphate isomerase/epimerase [Phycisphaerae bacterium]|nr:sugar phosphate isomerase/epimerase [Planctomycetota bacterium]MBL7218590.1 sugar phosphate isomerase/epimerase [Phycisphaerae bacterium]
MNNLNVNLSRRTLLGGAAAAAAVSMMPKVASAKAPVKPNSVFGGVQIGVITYSYRSMRGPATDMLKHITQSGISSIELMGNIPEALAGAPRKRGEIGKWRLSVSMDKFEAIRKQYNDAGVNIHIVKFGSIGNGKMPEAEMEYYFKAAKALGAKGITREISGGAAEHTAALAKKHQVLIGMHNHTQLTPTTYDVDWFKKNKYVAMNLDIGHYAARNNESALSIMKKYPGKIISLHVKDRKFKTNGAANMPFGKGDSAIAEILQYMKKIKAPFPADIELEYPVPKGSDAVKEVAKCLEFCKKALA